MTRLRKISPLWLIVSLRQIAVRVNLVFVIILSLLWPIVIVVNGQNWTSHLAICGHTGSTIKHGSNCCSNHWHLWVSESKFVKNVILQNFDNLIEPFFVSKFEPRCDYNSAEDAQRRFVRGRSLLNWTRWISWQWKKEPCALVLHLAPYLPTCTPFRFIRLRLFLSSVANRINNLRS